METFAGILRQNGVKHETEGRYCRPGWVQFQCPFCYGGKDPNKLYCGYNIHYGYVNCWRCGSHSAQKTLASLLSISYKQAGGLLLALDVERRLAEPQEERGGILVLPKGRGKLVSAHRRYLRERGFSWREVEKLWGVQGLTLHKRLPWRLFIPIHYHGRVVSWTTRRLSNKEPRYVSASIEEEAIHHKTLLYGEDYVRGNSIIVHEGPTDVWKTGPGACGLLGTGFTRAQINKLSRYAKRIICLDNSIEAQMRARKLCNLLEPFPGETINVILDAPDPGSAPAKEIKRLRRLLG